MNSQLIDSATTQDSQDIKICLQTKDTIDSVLETNILNDVKKTMNKSLAINKHSPMYNTVNISDSKGNNRSFTKCFILTWDANYKTVVAADLISYVEV